MIIDELIARLGFKVDGLDKVRAATKAMSPLKRDLKSTASATALAAAGAGRFRGALAGLAVMLRKAGGALKAMLLGLIGFIGRSAAVAGGLGLIAAAAMKMAVGFAKARGEAAQLRREASALAGQQRTTTGTQSAFEGAVQLQGFSADFAKKIREGLFDKLAEAADQAIRGEGDGKDKLKKLGIGSAMDADGNQRDAGALAIQAMVGLLKRQSEAMKLRAKADALPPGSKDRRAARAPANKAELSLRKDLEELGLGKDFEALIRQLAKAGVSVDQFIASLDKAASLNPSENQDQSQRTKELAEAWGRISVASAGISEAFGRLKDFLVNGFIGPVADAIEGIVNLGKRLGLINETAKEKNDRQAQEFGRMSGRHRQGERDFANGMSPDELSAYHLAQSMRQQQAMLQKRKGEIGSNPNATQKQGIDKAEASIESYKAEIRKLLESMGSLSEAMKAIQKEVSPSKNVDGMMRDKKAEAIKNEDNRQYSDIGNDQRTQSVSVTVNATGLEGAVAAIKNAISSSNLIKATTATTGAITQA